MKYVECQLDPDTPTASILTPLIFDDVCNFFSDSEDSNTKTVSLCKYNRRSLHQKILVKTYDGCSMFFSQSVNCFHVYNGFLERVIRWSKCRIDEAEYCVYSERLGEHITFGLKNDNTIDILETHYKTIKTGKYILIAEKPPPIYYSENPKTYHLVADKQAKHHLAAILWNDIARFKYALYAEVTQITDSRESGSKYRPLTIKEIFEIVDKRLALLPNPVVQNQVYFLRIPHIPKAREYAAIRRLQRYINSQNNISTIQLISDFNLRASVLVIGDLAQK